MGWWRSTPRHLPLTKGPFVPGCFDFMSGYGSGGVFARIYYPTSIKNHEEAQNRWYRWCPHEKYIEGFAKIVQGYATLIKMVVWGHGGEPLVPAAWEGPLCLGEGTNSPSVAKLPLILYSHGFGATRFICATIAAELASQGFLFACIEHRESSAAATYYYESEDERNDDKKTWIPHTKIQFGPNHYAIRNEQLHKRKEEMIKLIDAMEQLNQGTAKNILNSTLDISAFKDRLDLSKICLMGHSFGGAATLLTLAADQRASCGVVLDGWMFPLKEEGLEITKPLLFINTQTFHIEANLSAMDKVVDSPPSAKEDKQVYTLRCTTHETHTDTPHVMGYWLNWFMKKLDPKVGTGISNHLTLQFLHKYLGFPATKDESEEYLEQQKSVILPGTHLFLKTRSTVN